MIRHKMHDQLISIIHEGKQLNGASELLSILASMISEFPEPLKENHIDLFMHIIIPLHKIETFSVYCEELYKCSMIYLDKDRSLAVPLIKGILKYWPFANSSKEILFLLLLQEVMALSDSFRLRPLIPMIFKRIAKCLNSHNFKLVETSINLFSDFKFLMTVNEYKTETF